MPDNQVQAKLASIHILPTEVTMSALRTILLLMFYSLTMLSIGPAAAQVPPHQPGTICFTPQFWCWLQWPLVPGQVCFCPTPYGPIRGIAG